MNKRFQETVSIPMVHKVKHIKSSTNLMTKDSSINNNNQCKKIASTLTKAVCTMHELHSVAM